MSMDFDHGGEITIIPEDEKIKSIMDIVIEDDVLTDGYVYASPEEEASMYEKVSVWRKIRWYRENADSPRINKEAVAQSLKELLAEWCDPKGSVSKMMIGAMENMPPHGVQRALEYYNIDYTSMESFLRRFTKEQFEGVLDTFVAIHKGEIPDCYSKGLANRIDTFRRPEAHTLEAIQADSDGLGNRYAARDARSTDILGLGFGYHKYLSLKNDYEESPSTVEQARNMLSLDHQVSVNRLYGIYAFLYAMLPIPRSREIGSWFCPGFHVTLWGWLAILIGSPIALAFGIASWEQDASLFLIVPSLIVGAWLPLALCYAFMWYIFARIVGKEKRDAWSESFVDYCRTNFEKDYWKYIGASLQITLIVAVVFAIAAAVGFGVYHWFWESMPHAVVYGGFTFLWAMYVWQEGEGSFPWNMDGLRILGTALCSFLALRLGYDLVVLSLAVLREYVASVAVVGVFFALTCFVVFCAVSAFRKVYEFRKQAFLGNDDIDVTRHRELRLQSLYWLLLIALPFAVGYAYLANMDFKIEQGWERAMYFGLGIFGLQCVVIFVRLEKGLRFDLEHARRFRAYKGPLFEDDFGYYNANKIALRMLEKCEWFLSLPLEEQRYAARQLKSIVDYIFVDEKNIPPAFWSMSRNAYDDLRMLYRGDRPRWPYKVSWSKENQRRLAVLILEGASFEEGLATLEKRKTLFEKIFAIVSLPFRPVGRLIDGIKAAASFVKDIASRCPRVSESARAQ